MSGPGIGFSPFDGVKEIGVEFIAAIETVVLHFFVGNFDHYLRIDGCSDPKCD